MADPAPLPAAAPDAPADLAAVPEPQEHQPTPLAWPAAGRVAFRFAFCFFALRLFPFPLGSIPFTEAVSQPIDTGVSNGFRWLTARLFGTPEAEMEPSGSGDGLHHYVSLGAVLALAAVGAIAWTLLDRKRRQYRTLAAWLTLGLRWSLFFNMMVYGFSKVIPLQMPWDEARLVEPLGSMSPMGLLWTFMGASAPYERLAGLGEVIGGLLLVWRRTAGVGALLLLAVLGNVVALNFCYDVPVKIFSAELWLMAAFIAAPDALRIFRLLVLRRPTEPAPDVALVRSERLKRFPRLRWLGPAAAIAWAGWGVYDHLPFEWAKRLAEMEAKAPVSGVYQVQSFTAPADARPGSAPAGAAWARVGGGLRRLSVLRADGSFGHIRFEQAPDGAVKLTPLDSEESTLVRVEHPDPEHVRIAAEGFEVKMKKIPRESFLLLRGFHWVQPKPLNR